MIAKILIIAAMTVFVMVLYAALVNMTPEEKRQEDEEQLEWLATLKKNKKKADNEE